jgi:iron complex outermembrane receptor protein
MYHKWIEIALIFILTASQLLIFSADVSAEYEYQLEPVIVYPSVLNEYYSDSLRHIEYWENPEDKFLNDLDNVTSVDMQSRGAFSVQSDLQMRGASFEQTDVLVDGVKINDPQTGHFNMDIPFQSYDLDKIIIVPGPAASINGASRPGGSVHIITKKPQGKSAKAKIVFGQNSFQSQEISLTSPFADINTRTTIGQSQSEGYRYNTDFLIRNFSHISNFQSGYGDVLLKFGMLDKEFGANGFYSEFFPGQREHTKTGFAAISLQSEYDSFFVNPQIYVRRQRDRFMLNKDDPAFYENRHLNYVKGAKIDLAYLGDCYKLFAGIDSARESIKSSSLNNHKRMKNTLYAALTQRSDPWIFSVGGSGFFHEDYKNRFAPDISLGYFANSDLKIRSAFSQSYRVPTFTELYYQSPANLGNPDLLPERTNNYEIGFDYARPAYIASMTYFIRQGKDLIDWVRAPQATVYNIVNVADVDTRGIQADIRIYPKEWDLSFKRWQEVYFGYAYIDQERKQNSLISKYVFDYLQHKFVLGSINILPWQISMDNKIVYQERVYRGGDFIINTRFDKQIDNYNIFLKIDNLFNHAYSEKGNIPMPGRWIFAGIELRW